ncbi:Acyltransferase [Enhygromyxa salina]|uniref:Acyltransferase n=2 Tax=Enhygromyxa salina TaxID=215803 RepID=A0A2S9YE61_9BACT|nr:Acyltransferase [Enhygromyxa salina]
MDANDGFERRPDSQRGRGFRARFAAFVLRLGGWTIGGAPPKLNKYVIIAAPHTTWWDGFWMLAFAWWWGIDLAWMGKASLVNGPLGWIPRRFGVIPVDRSAPQGLVAQIVGQFASRESLLLAIPPEGTRSKRDYWKSGFYQIARGSELPICMSYLDYANREAGFGPLWEPGEDIVADMDRVRRFYKTEWARYPELFTPPRLREEEMSPVVPLMPKVEPVEPLREVAQG